MKSCPDCGAVAWGNATCPTCRAHWPDGDPLASEQERLGAELLSMRRRSPKAPLSKLHDKLMERAR